MNLISKRRHELATAPGVAVTVRALTEKRRIALVLATADDEAELLEIQDKAREQLRIAEPEILAAKAAVETKSENAETLKEALTRNPAARSLMTLHAEGAAIQRRIDEAVVRSTVVSVDGLKVDGEDVDVEGLVEFAPAAMFTEVVALAKAGVGMSEEERGNSESPTILVA